MTRLYHKWLIMPKAVRWPLVILFYLSLISTYVLAEPAFWWGLSIWSQPYRPPDFQLLGR